MTDIVERLRKQSRRVAELYGDPEPPDDDMKPADLLWFTAQEAADEIEQLRAEAAAQAAQSARQCRDLLRAEGEIALAYERGYDDAVRLMRSEA